MLTLHTLTRILGKDFDDFVANVVYKTPGVWRSFTDEEERFYQDDNMSIKVKGNSKVARKDGCIVSRTHSTVVTVNNIGVLEIEGIHYKIISDFINDVTKFIGNRRNKPDVLLEIKNTDELAIAFKIESAVLDGPKYINIATLVWKNDLPKLEEVKIVPLPANFDGVGVPYEIMRSNVLDKISLQGGVVDCPIIFKANAMIEEERDSGLYTANAPTIAGDRKVYVTITAE